ncbi:MAG: hypothetical protein A07HB70_02044 [uncultured archaeon A07HB70]|nr:MAG: hypothetical protein A07HB70_02044 [uncultured archaeon A07HB70]
MATDTYRCLHCQDHTVARAFDVSHISMTCPVCESFERLVNDRVVEQFRALENSSPESLDWDRLDRTEKLFVAERVARRGRDASEFSVAGVSDDTGTAAGDASGERPEPTEASGDESAEDTGGDEQTAD